MKTLKERIAIEQAYLDGETVLYQNASNGVSWPPLYSNDPEIVFDWEAFDYRIKPEPMELWVNVYKDSDGQYISTHLAEHEAERSATPNSKHIKTIKVREVL